MEPNTVLIPDNDYIYRYIVPGDPATSHHYGANTYWGGQDDLQGRRRERLRRDRADRRVQLPAPAFDDFFNLPEILGVVGSLKCSMYDNALVPIALANKLVSLSEFPSARILGNFAKGTINIG